MNNAWRIALFIFMLQLGIQLVMVAGVPITCDEYGECVGLSWNLMSARLLTFLLCHPATGNTTRQPFYK